MPSNIYNSDSIKTEIMERATIGRQQVKDGKFTIIDDSYFDDARSYIRDKFIDAGINEGIADIDAGKCMELRQDNIKDVLSKPLSEW